MGEVPGKEGKRTKAQVIHEALNGLRQLASEIKGKTALLTYLPAGAEPEKKDTQDPSNFTEEILRGINSVQEDLEYTLKILQEFI